MSDRKCLHCNAAQTSEHRLKTCSRCKAVSYCNTTCQHADWPTHKLVCNKHEGLRLSYASGAGENVVFQDPSGGTCDEVCSRGASISLRMPPLPEIPLGLAILLEIEPAVAEELAGLAAGERVAIEQATGEMMKDMVHEDIIRQAIVEAIEMAKKARMVARRGEVEDEKDGGGESEGGDEDDDEDGLWEKVRKILAIKY